MSVLLRVELIALSAFFLYLALRTIRAKKLLVQYALLWVLFAVLMLIFALLPGLAAFLTGLFGIEMTANFIYLSAIVALLFLCFSLTIIVSRQTIQIKNIVQTVSLEMKLKDEKKK